MSSLWWPGDHRAESLMGDQALLDALLRVEQTWLDALVATGIAPAEAGGPLPRPPGGLGALAVAAEPGGNPVVPLVGALREVAPAPASQWLHRGLTSQDVLDTAMMLCAREAVDRVCVEVRAQVARLAELAQTHRDTPAVARTLTQHALPTRFGATVAGWLNAVLDAQEQLLDLRWPAQVGGAAGTLAALVELGGPAAARDARRRHIGALGLEVAACWHTARAPLTRLGDAAVTATDAWGKVARDVLNLARPEIGELVDGSAGGSSTMPHKANPTLAVLVRRAALAGPPLASTLHLAAADQVDQRADGSWHVEWQTLAILLRRTVVAASHLTELLDRLQVRSEVMAARLAEAETDLLAEQRAMSELTGRAPAATYTGLAHDLVDDALARARRHPDSGSDHHQERP